MVVVATGLTRHTGSSRCLPVALLRALRNDNCSKHRSKHYSTPLPFEDDYKKFESLPSAVTGCVREEGGDANNRS